MGFHNKNKHAIRALDSPAERFSANPHLSGKDGGQEINLHQFARDGIRLLGRLEDLQGRQARLAPDLHQNLARADQAADDFRAGVDKYVRMAGLDAPEEPVTELQDGYQQEVTKELDPSRNR